MYVVVAVTVVLGCTPSTTTTTSFSSSTSSTETTLTSTTSLLGTLAGGFINLKRFCWVAAQELWESCRIMCIRSN